MEEDRAIADLGPELPIDLDGEDETAKKTPKRRFIGRRAADAKAAAKGDAQANGNGTIEDSGAVQGADYTYTAQHHNGIISSCLVQLLPAAALPVP
jgi:2-(3-amino-3-carboxypropyl)histidine synthase